MTSTQWRGGDKRGKITEKEVKEESVGKEILTRKLEDQQKDV